MKPSVMVFDDDPALGRLVTKVAGLSGLEATSVTDAASFEQAFRTRPPDVIVLDLQLGATDGVEQLRRLVDWKFAGALILMSGQGSRLLTTVGALGKSMGLKVEGVLQKPLRISDLERLFAGVTTGPRLLSSECLMAAIMNGEMVLDFQPIVSRNPKTLKKLEALVRWEHPCAGLISPDTFLPIAEADPVVIDLLTAWVVDAAIKAHGILSDFGVSVPIAVNISMLNLQDSTLPDRLEEKLRAAGMPATHLCLEVTERTAFNDVMVTMEVLSRLRLKGIPLSIDDFGTGYSSLTLLRQMPFSEIKIDRSFVSDMTTSRDSQAIAKSMIELAGKMEMTCVVEGIETEEVAQVLERLGACDLQGYLIARPMRVEAVPIWLKSWLDADTRIASPRETLAGPFIRPTMVDDVAPDMAVSQSINAIRLSPRQTEVMRLLSEGRSVKEIARILKLGVGTVKVHLASAYAALGVHNRVEAIKRAAPVLLASPALLPGLLPDPVGGRTRNLRTEGESAVRSCG